ncbi:MAG: AAA family ATPase [Archangiaceae bacterium]|nr:AAA family ATPase [Archangiaceae bacterium]
MRDVDHFQKLEALLQLERQEERERFALDRRELPLSELAARGRVLLDVEAKEFNTGLGGRTLVTFELGHGARLPLRLSPGELVAVSPRKAEVEAPPTGVVSRSTGRSVQVAFERPPPEFVSEGRLRLDVLANDATFERARHALTAIAAMDKGVARRRREVLLGNEPPFFERVEPFESSRPLNPEQTEAVGKASSARDFFLVHGPPGTGKSHVLAEVAVQCVRQGQRVLATAASNAAVDHLLELCLESGLEAVRVGHPARVLPHLQAHTLDLLVEENDHRKTSRALFDEAYELLGYARKQRGQGRSRARFANAREAQAEARKMIDEARVLERRAVAAVLERAQVVCSTLASLEGHVLSLSHFDTALLDEATQATEPLSLMAFVKADRVILAGDPQQLAPTVLSAKAKALEVSLFERLLADHGEGVKQLLKEQHRFPTALMEFPSREMYGGALRAHPSVADARLGDEPPFLFIDTAGKGFDEQVGEGTASLRNEGEGELIALRLKMLGLPPQEVGVITPYRAQAEGLRERLGIDELEVDTVDAFQGREKTAILVSLVRSNNEGTLGFLEDLRRINVAITRAKRHLFVVGDSATLGRHPFYARLIEHAQNTGAYRSAWEWPENSSP